MGKRRDLNGLPNSLEQRYFSTLFWWDKAYMADWIWNAAIQKGVTDIEIDILQGNVDPKELEIKPIVAQFSKLRETITRTLDSNNFPTDFIVDAKFKIYISQKHKTLRLLSCQASVTDREGNLYEGKIYTEKAYGTPFKVFPVSLIDRIKGLIKK
ncbi:hypothetical protein O3Q51_16250 [Cryomorphaceae bacterium 1068]|nr:hypothetical protein [Cryomorphaceae bacterium 1068]